MRRILIFGVGVCSASVAPAAKWVTFAECGNSHHPHIYSYDPASISARRGNLLVTISGDYSTDPASRARSGRMRWSLNCTARTFFEQSRKDFGANNSVVASYQTPSQTMAVIADSVAYKLANKICP